MITSRAVVRGIATAIILLAAGPGLAEGETATPKAIVLEVGLVRVSPHRPGTDKPWDEPVEQKKTDPCDLFGFPGMGKALSTACDLLESGSGPSSLKHDPSDPDLFIRIMAGPGVTYRSYTVANTVSHTFHFKTLVPVDAIPNAGLELSVQDDDSTGDDDTQENIGTLRLTKKALLDALSSDGMLRLDDKEGGLEKIEVLVSPWDEAPQTATQLVDVSKHAATVDGFEALAGEVLELRASGPYTVAGQRTDGTGLPFGSPLKFNLKGAPFERAAHGAGIALVGKHRMLERLMVAPCGVVLTRYAGPIAVGVNDLEGKGAAGDAKFELLARAPTVDEWKRGQTAQKCTPPVVATTAAVASAGDAAPDAQATKWSTTGAQTVQEFLRANGEEIAQRIQQITHPTGSGPHLGEFRVDPMGDDGLQVRIESVWLGGILHGKHTTTVLWELNSRRHVHAVVERDTANVAVAAPNLRKLNEYFEQVAYPRAVADRP
jgi:hypothetical protein